MTDELPFLHKLGTEFSQLTARDELAARSTPALRWRRPVSAVIASGLAAVILGLIALSPSERSSGLAEAYAAVAPAGKIVHAISQVTITSGDRTVTRQSIETYWDGTRLRTLTSEDGRLTSEATMSSDDKLATYLPKSDSIRQSPLKLLGGDRYRDPIELFRQLYRSHMLHDAGTQAFNGKTVTKATMRDGNELRTWLFDKDTQLPVRYSIVTDGAGSPSYSYTADFSTYERLAPNATNEQRLDMGSHPGADRTTGPVRPSDVR